MTNHPKTKSSEQNSNKIHEHQIITRRFLVPPSTVGVAWRLLAENLLTLNGKKFQGHRRNSVQLVQTNIDYIVIDGREMYLVKLVFNIDRPAHMKCAVVNPDGSKRRYLFKVYKTTDFTKPLRILAKAHDAARLKRWDESTFLQLLPE